MKKRNIYFAVSLITYLFLAVFLIMKCNGVREIQKVLLILGAVILAFLNVTPSFNRNSYNKEKIIKKQKNDNSKNAYSQKKKSMLADLSYITKLMIPFSIITDLFHSVTDKPVFYYVFSAIGLAGFIVSAYLGVKHLLVIFPNHKCEKDDIDKIGDGVIINLIFIFPLIWEIFLSKFENAFYSYALFAVPTIIVTAICFFYNMPKTELEKIFRVASVAAACLMLIFFTNSIRYTDIKTDQGMVIEAYYASNSDDTDLYKIMKSNGEIFTIEFGSFEKNDNVKIEYKTGLLGMKIVNVSSE